MLVPYLAFEDLVIPERLTALPRKRENKLRIYYVDGNRVEMYRDVIESLNSYEYRCSWTLARSFNPGQRLDELVINSRIALNKRWSPIVRDQETKEYLRTPYYSDIVEERYRKAKNLPAMDSRVEKRIETKEIKKTEIEQVEQQETEQEKEEEEKEQEEIENASYDIEKKGNIYELTVLFPIYIRENKKRFRNITEKDKRTILSKIYKIYTARLSGLGNIVKPRIEIEDDYLLFVMQFASEEKAKKAYNEILENIQSVEPPIETSVGIIEF